MVPSPSTHALSALFANVARGVFPPQDGRTDVYTAPPGPVHALLAFTGHHVIAAGIDPAWVAERLQPGDLITPMSATFIADLATAVRGDPVSLDVILCAASSTDSSSIELHEIDGAEHHRVAIARTFRTNVRVFVTADGAGLVTLGRGLGGRWESSFEVEPAHQQRGLGRVLALEARRRIPSGDAVFMQIAPANATSLRAAWAAGYVPIGSEVLFLKGSESSDEAPMRA